MCGLFAAMLRARRALAPRAGAMMQQRAGLVSGKPAKHNIGASELTVAMTVLYVAVLAPSGWVLSQLDYYKSRD